jgi:branched-chain amino acid transport system substrate-binding protein
MPIGAADLTLTNRTSGTGTACNDRVQPPERPETKETFGMKRHSQTLWTGLFGLACIVALIAYSVVNSPTRAADKKPVIVGGTLGLTGAFAAPSAEYKAVYDRWATEVNKAGGLLGRPVELKIYNDESTPTTAQALYNRLINQDKADLLLAPYTTFVGGAIVPIVLSHHKLLFNGGFVGINLFDNAKGWIIGSYTYQEPDYTRGIFDLIKSLPAEKRPKRVAILTAQNPFTIVVRAGHQGKGGALNFAKAAGMKVVVDEQYPPSTTDFTGLVQKAKTAKADLLLSLGLPNDELQIARAVKQQDYKPAIYCVCGSQMTTVPAWFKLGDANEGVMGTTVSWPNQNYPGLADLAKYFKGRGYEAVPTYGVVSMAILEVLTQAVNGAKTLDQTKLQAYIHSHTFHTVAGNIKFQANGTPVYSEVILQTQHGKDEVVWPVKYRTAAPVVPMR